MLRNIAIGIIVVGLGLIAFVASRPPHSHIERSAVVSGTPAVVFARVNTMKSFPLWSPWERFDPDMSRTFTGPDEGVGSSYRWSGNDKIGEGKLTITESRPGEAVVGKLEFIRPLVSESTVTLTIKEASATTSTVTWAMDGENDFMQKAASAFMDMDKAVGLDFDFGLQNLEKLITADTKLAAERAATALAETEAAAAAAAADGPPPAP